MDKNAAMKALRHIDWDQLLTDEDGTQFPALHDGLPVLGTKVASSTDRSGDWDDDRNVSVTIELLGQYWKNKGWGAVGSHCYGEYETSWYGIEEVFPKTKTVLIWE